MTLLGKIEQFIITQIIFRILKIKAPSVPKNFSEFLCLVKQTAKEEVLQKVINKYKPS